MIADLHSDLLCYLAGDPNRTPYDPCVRCSIPQLEAGGVVLQVLPIYTATEPGSVESGSRQIEWFNRLLEMHSNKFTNYLPELHLTDGKIAILLAVENASSLFGEDEPLEAGLSRLQTLQDSRTKPLYLSFTWNSENRFGGGAHTAKGLKSDGKELLHFLAGKSIAVDLSHSSDTLAYDIIDEINRSGLDIPLIASHSNARAVCDMARNLPDDLITEIVNRKGVIGLNFVRYFLGEDPQSSFHRHLEHLLSLGARDALCFGADFFYGNDVPPAHRKKPEELFFPGFDNSSCYPSVIEGWNHTYGIEESILDKITSENLINFIESMLYVAIGEASN